MFVQFCFIFFMWVCVWFNRWGIILCRTLCRINNIWCCWHEFNIILPIVYCSSFFDHCVAYVSSNCIQLLLPDYHSDTSSILNNYLLIPIHWNFYRLLFAYSLFSYMINCLMILTYNFINYFLMSIGITWIYKWLNSIWIHKLTLILYIQ